MIVLGNSISIYVGGGGSESDESWEKRQYAGSGFEAEGLCKALESSKQVLCQDTGARRDGHGKHA